MSNQRIVLDPTAERDPLERGRLPRPKLREGLRVGLLDISKPRGDVFLDRVEELLSGLGVTVARYKKPTFTRVAPTDLLQKISTECDLVVEGLAD